MQDSLDNCLCPSYTQIIAPEHLSAANSFACDSSNDVTLCLDTCIHHVTMDLHAQPGFDLFVRRGATSSKPLPL
jgi:hypothetical protein